MNGMRETDVIEIIKHLIMLLEEARQEVKDLKKEIEELKTYIWNKEHPMKADPKEMQKILQDMFDLPVLNSVSDPDSCTTVGKSPYEVGCTYTAEEMAQPGFNPY